MHCTCHPQSVDNGDITLTWWYLLHGCHSNFVSVACQALLRKIGFYLSVSLYIKKSVFFRSLPLWWCFCQEGFSGIMFPASVWPYAPPEKPAPWTLLSPCYKGSHEGRHCPHLTHVSCFSQDPKVAKGEMVRYRVGPKMLRGCDAGHATSQNASWLLFQEYGGPRDVFQVLALGMCCASGATKPLSCETLCLQKCCYQIVPPKYLWCSPASLLLCVGKGFLTNHLCPVELCRSKLMIK